MCGRYLLDEADQIALRFHVEDWDEAELKPNYNVAPTQVMPVVTQDDDGKRHLEMMKWGIPRILGKDLVKELINTRADKAFGGFWRKTVCNRRCLIPANGFYEWKGQAGNKTPFFIHPKFEKLYAFAGIWDTWKSDDGHEIKVYSIMTTEPNKEMKSIHNRAPVMLHREDEASWLEPSNDKQEVLEKLLFPLEDNSLEIYEVSRDVNVVRNNIAKLFLPINSQ
ncbi:SOS response-associated peptidase [Candidatus Saccharibacteria bacterium]|nr:MAG: SOS response-associated peptidase [Candidatus Saccharibacteria bacterium]